MPCDMPPLVATALLMPFSLTPLLLPLRYLRLSFADYSAPCYARDFERRARAFTAAQCAAMAQRATDVYVTLHILIFDICHYLMLIIAFDY